jgi:hypothetical protein
VVKMKNHFINKICVAACLSFAFIFCNGVAEGSKWTETGDKGVYGDIYKNEDGDLYDGEFKDGKPNGHGKLTSADTSVYEGEFKDGIPNGEGTYVGDGKKYVGNFDDGLPSGYGKIIENGEEYEGEFENGERHGKGKLKRANGEVSEVEYKNGKEVVEEKATKDDDVKEDSQIDEPAE